MNIQAINNQTSFKGVYSPKGLHFSESQLKVIDDIKSRADEKMDFIVFNNIIIKRLIPDIT